MLTLLMVFVVVQVRGLKEEQRNRFEQLEHLVEETRGMVENQVLFNLLL